MSFRSLSVGALALVSLSACGASAPPRSAYGSLPTTRAARRMIEMTLRRIGDSQWPAGGAVDPTP